MRHQILHSACEVPLEMPTTDLDLPQWLFRLSDKEYQACSKGHLAAGGSILPDGTQTSGASAVASQVFCFGPAARFGKNYCLLGTQVRE
jgi:hypothetical protein